MIVELVGNKTEAFDRAQETANPKYPNRAICCICSLKITYGIAKASAISEAHTAGIAFFIEKTLLLDPMVIHRRIDYIYNRSQRS